METNWFPAVVFPVVLPCASPHCPHYLGLVGGPGAGRLCSLSARGWLAFGWRLAGVWLLPQGAGPADPARRRPGPSCTGWLVPVVAVCVGAPQARWQKVTMPLGIGCGIALLC